MRYLVWLPPWLLFLVLGVGLISFPQRAAGQTAHPTSEPFVDVSAAAGIHAAHRARWDEFSKVRPFEDGYMAIGQAWGDYNNDGWVDLYVTGNLTTSTLYQNNRDGTFSLSPLNAQVSLPDRMTGGATWADYDNDGWRDLYVLAHGANVLFRNDQGRGFTDVTATAAVGDPGKSTSAAWGDYDQDSFLDLYVTNWSCFPKCDPVDPAQAQDRLYHNNGDGTFADVTDTLVYSKTLGSGFAVSFVDHDNDGDLDIYVVNDKVQNPIGNVLWRNDGLGCDGWCWVDASAEAGLDLQMHSMALATGDVNNDQALDFYITNMIDPGAFLQNQGAGVFQEQALTAGLPATVTNTVGWGASLFDYDNDGWLDLSYVATEFIKFNELAGPLGMFFEYPSVLYRNQGQGRFANRTPASWQQNPRPGMGLATADYDQDGGIDFVVGYWDQGYALYRNLATSDQHWLTLRLVGGGPVNRDAVGARVYLTTTTGLTQMRELKIGSSIGAGEATDLHFGLGEAQIKSLKVVWPDGVTSTYSLVAADRIWTLAYPRPDKAPAKPVLVDTSNDVLRNVSQAVGITAQHRGEWDMFGPNFDHGYLGIGQAWADYDNDGWLDLYVTGNLTTSTLYRNNGDGTFALSPLAAQVSLADRPTGGASWADYDNDGWKDLYVLVHGANVLFQNDAGQGFRDVTAQAGVGDMGRGSSATWGDYDQDGYLDLYVVNWSCFPECGDPPDHTLASDRLYHNNGNGTFSDASHLLVAEKLQGAGFTAAFVDYDNDSDVDLYVINDELKNPIGNVLWRNDGPGCAGWCWADVSAATGADVKLAGMGLAVGDYDADLDLDFYFSNMVNPMRLFQNETGSAFFNQAKEAGVAVGPSSAVGWGTVFFDYDNDGWLDLYLAATEFLQHSIDSGPQGMLLPHPNFLFRNNGNGSFTDASPASWQQQPNPGMGLAYADYDNDGWQDLVVGNFNQGYALLRNQGLTGRGNHWLSVRLTGGGSINRDAVGTRVYVLDSTGRVQMQSVVNGGSLGAGNDLALHFGLGQARVKAVTVIWPNGEISLYGDVPVDQVWPVVYGKEATTN